MRILRTKLGSCGRGTSALKHRITFSACSHVFIGSLTEEFVLREAELYPFPKGTDSGDHLLDVERESLRLIERKTKIKKATKHNNKNSLTKIIRVRFPDWTMSYLHLAMLSHMEFVGFILFA